MGTLRDYREMSAAEVARIHAGMRLVEREDRAGDEIVADLICFYKSEWPAVIRAALRLARAAQRGDDS